MSALNGCPHRRHQGRKRRSRPRPTGRRAAPCRCANWSAPPTRWRENYNPLPRLDAGNRVVSLLETVGPRATWRNSSGSTAPCEAGGSPTCSPWSRTPDQSALAGDWTGTSTSGGQGQKRTAAFDEIPRRRAQAAVAAGRLRAHRQPLRGRRATSPWRPSAATAHCELWRDDSGGDHPPGTRACSGTWSATALNGDLALQPGGAGDDFRVPFPRPGHGPGKAFL